MLRRRAAHAAGRPDRCRRHAEAKSSTSTSAPSTMGYAPQDDDERGPVASRGPHPPLGRRSWYSWRCHVARGLRRPALGAARARYRYSDPRVGAPSPTRCQRLPPGRSPDRSILRRCALAADAFLGSTTSRAFCRRPPDEAERRTLGASPVRVDRGSMTCPRRGRLCASRSRPTSFCQQMVRSIVGALVVVGAGSARQRLVAILPREAAACRPRAPRGALPRRRSYPPACNLERAARRGQRADLVPSVGRSSTAARRRPPGFAGAGGRPAPRRIAGAHLLLPNRPR